MKLGLVAASLVLLVGGAVGCSDDDSGGGGGGDASDVTSTADFCGALEGFKADLSAADPASDVGAYIKALKDAAAKLENVGTPEGMPADAEAGFEITVGRIDGLDDAATIEDFTSISELSDEDQKKVDALNDYIVKECPELGGETPSPS
jgi:hypothetical protein